MKYLFLSIFSFTTLNLRLFANSITDIEIRVSRLEKQVKILLKRNQMETLDMGGKTFGGSNHSSSNPKENTPQEKRKMKEALKTLKKYQDRKEEQRKYLKELMQEP